MYSPGPLLSDCFYCIFFPAAGSCSLFTGGWDNNVKYLKAELKVQEDKNPGSQDLTNNTPAASVCGHSYLLTRHRDKPLTASVSCDSESAHPTDLTVQSARHVLFLHCHDDARWLLGGDCVCPATIQGGAASPCKRSPSPSQVSVLMQISKTNCQTTFVRS